MKIAIYTSIFGGKDTLRSPFNYEFSLEVKYYLFTDENTVEVFPYEKVILDSEYYDVSKNSKEVKINGINKEPLSGFDYVIWHDANIQINHNEILKLMRFNEKFNLSAFRHPYRSCAYSEAIACVKKNKDSPFTIAYQMSKYFLNGLPANFGLSANGILLIKNTLASQEIMKLWWLEVKRNSRRDQLSLPFVLFKNNFSINYLEGNVFDNNVSIYNKHNYKYYIKKNEIQTYNQYIQSLSIKYLKALRKIKCYILKTRD
jgi:hypothetical protein